MITIRSEKRHRVGVAKGQCMQFTTKVIHGFGRRVSFIGDFSGNFSLTRSGENKRDENELSMRCRENVPIVKR
jgi:hypothetical protein